MLCAGGAHLRGALSVCNRYVSLLHCLTAEDLFFVSFACCVLFGGVVWFVFGCFCCLVLFCLRSSSFDRSWVTATSCLPSRFVKVRPSQLSWRVRQWIKKTLMPFSFSVLCWVWLAVFGFCRFFGLCLFPSVFLFRRFRIFSMGNAPAPEVVKADYVIASLRPSTS